MGIDKNNKFVITNYLTETGQRDTSLGQVPFIFGAARGNPKSMRIFLEAVLSRVNWQTRSVANEGTLTVNDSDVVIFCGHSAVVNLPAVGPGRLLVIKDTSGAASTTDQHITINRNGSDTIDGTNTSFRLAANYGALILVGDQDNSRWHTIALV